MKRVLTPTNLKANSCKSLKHVKSSSNVDFSELHFTIFDRFPAEILFYIFSFLEVSDLSNIALTCRAGRSSVSGFVSSSYCLQLRQFRNPHPPNAPANIADVKGYLSYYYQIGESPEEELAIRIFLRRVFLDPHGLPLSKVPAWTNLSSSDMLQSSSRRNLSLSTPSELFTASGYVSPSITSFSDDSFYIASVTDSSLSLGPIRSASLIKTSRACTSCGCDNPTHNPSNIWPTASFLANVLHSYPFVHQARLLFILYGPVHKGRLMWSIMCENTAADLKQLSACFGELGRVLSGLWLSGHWSASDTLAVLHEITNTPDCWLAENVACLLHSAGPQLASLAVQHKASKGYVAELAVILTSLCLVQVKIKEDLSGLLKLVGVAVESTGNAYRQEFLDSLSNAFRSVIVDLYETDELDERLEDFSIILKAQSYFFRALLARVYEE